ncbi:MAG: DNA repair protein RecO [Phycisphaerae bacterium]|nr:DNA repair protein RecO [Phycisphaerae bacterium]
MQIKDRAICLRAVDFSETSQVVTLLTRQHGKIAAMAKGSRRPKNRFDGPIEIFSRGEAVFIAKESGGLAALTEFNQEPPFTAFAQNIEILYSALFGAELTEHFLKEHDPYPELFDTFTAFLETLQKETSACRTLAWLILYQIRLLDKIGLAPVWDRCTNCAAALPEKTAKKPSAVYFSSRNNGLLCVACEQAFVEKRAVQPAVVGVLAEPSKLPVTEIHILQEIERLLIYHITELLGKAPKMAGHFT